jgi:hypothetical protein
MAINDHLSSRSRIDVQLNSPVAMNSDILSSERQAITRPLRSVAPLSDKSLPDTNFQVNRGWCGNRLRLRSWSWCWCWRWGNNDWRLGAIEATEDRVYINKFIQGKVSSRTADLEFFDGIVVEVLAVFTSGMLKLCELTGQGAAPVQVLFFVDIEQFVG